MGVPPGTVALSPMTGRGAGSPERLVTQLEMEAAARAASHVRFCEVSPGRAKMQGVARRWYRPRRGPVHLRSALVRTALDDHVHRPPRLGQWVLISGSWDQREV